MKVLKFGGTSVGSPQRIKAVAELLKDQEQKFVVLSAMSGTTDALYDIVKQLYHADKTEALSAINEMEKKYNKHVEAIFSTEKYRNIVSAFIAEEFTLLRNFASQDISSVEEKIIVAQGEILSTTIFFNYLQETGVPAVLIPALKFMKLNRQGDPDTETLKEKLSALMEDAAANSKAQIKVFLTQGFICRDANDEISNLTRGGSDYTASLIGAAIGAQEIQIWTDIDGLHNNDPRIVGNTSPVHKLHFEEASELAYFGAKIIHPSCIQPARQANIPVRLKSSMDPQAEGTLVSNDMDSKRIKAIAAKSNITAIKIKSSKKLLAYGFMNRIFEIFDHYKTTVDMVCTSEVGVSVTIDNDGHLDKICQELSQVGRVSIEREMCIICVVGDMAWEQGGFEGKIIAAMGDIPIRMISYGGSNFNISLLVKEADKKRALEALSINLF